MALLPHGFWICAAVCHMDILAYVCFRVGDIHWRGRSVPVLKPHCPRDGSGDGLPGR